MRIGLSAALLLLAGCSGEEPQAPQPTPSASPVAVATTPAPAIDDRPQPRPGPGGVARAILPAPELEGTPAPGGWALRASATGAAATFGEEGAEPRFSLRCDPQARRIVLVRTGARGGGRLRVVVGGGSASFTARATSDGTPRIEASAPAQDTFLTQVLAPNDGPIAVMVDAGPVLLMPAGEPAAQVIRSCQPG